MASKTFTFRALDSAGVQQSGTISGPTSDAVSSELRRRGLVVVDVKERTGALSFDIRIGKKIKPNELTIVTRQLATMISAGMTLLRSCYVLEEQVQNRYLKEVLAQVRDDIESGLQFSDALSRHPKTFSPLYVAMVRAGEAGGVLEQSLERVSDQLEKEDALRRQVRSALVYPSVVLSVAFTVLTILVLFIIPIFAGIFKSFGSKLPLLTRVTLGVSNFATSFWYIILLAVIAAIFGFRYWRRTPAGHAQWDRMILKAPFRIGMVVQKVALARWSRTFASLYGAGVPIMQTIDVTGKTAGNMSIEKAMEDVIASIRAGGTIAAPLRDEPVFPTMVCQMVAVGEESGNLDGMLSKVADFYEDEVEVAVRTLTSLLEPLMILTVGVIVGFIVISMYLPMFKVYDAISKGGANQ